MQTIIKQSASTVIDHAIVHEDSDVTLCGVHFAKFDLRGERLPIRGIQSANQFSRGWFRATGEFDAQSEYACKRCARIA